MIHFSLPKNIYATEFEDAIIILHVANDQYLSLIDEAAHYFKLILETPCSLNEANNYIPCGKNCDDATIKSLNNWIQDFIAQGLIVATNSSNTKKIYPTAKVPGGLREYQWDTKKDWKTFKKTSYLSALKALWTLRKVNRAMNKKGMRGLFDLINKTTKKPQKIVHSLAKINHISAAVDSATKLYPKKIYCLGWASTFVIEARKHNIDCSLMIGIQTNPFYAHAWAQLGDGTVVNDDPQIAQVLSIIAKLPEEQE